MNLVKKLNEKWDNHVMKQKFPYGVGARWWLNAIADEIAQTNIVRDQWEVVYWLRAQAKED